MLQNWCVAETEPGPPPVSQSTTSPFWSRHPLKPFSHFNHLAQLSENIVREPIRIPALPENDLSNLSRQKLWCSIPAKDQGWNRANRFHARLIDLEGNGPTKQ